jgi:hypothetical protein
VVELNCAIAIAETKGPEAGLGIVDRLGLDGFRYLHATRAELLRRLGRTDEARDAYRRARQRTGDGAERRFLERRLTELAATRLGLSGLSADKSAAGSESPRIRRATVSAACSSRPRDDVAVRVPSLQVLLETK